MNIYERLIADHERQRVLIERLLETSGDSNDRRKLWHALRVEAEAHANAEEQTLYAELIAIPDGQEEARHSVAEHKEMQDIIDELEEMPLDSTGWLTRFKTLAHDLRHHVEEEESEIFIAAEKVISAKRAHEMADEFVERKRAEATEV